MAWPAKREPTNTAGGTESLLDLRCYRSINSNLTRITDGPNFHLAHLCCSIEEGCTQLRTAGHHAPLCPTNGSSHHLQCVRSPALLRNNMRAQWSGSETSVCIR